jgi:hypothetical protein
MDDFCRVVFFAVLFGIGTMADGCGDSPTGPGSGKQPDYIVYFTHPDYHDYYAYHTSSGVLDSFELPYKAKWFIAISPGGGKMYMPTGTSIAAIDLKTNSLIREKPQQSSGMELEISPDGHYLATEMPRPDHKGLQIIRTSDFSVVYQDTVWWSYGQFSQNNRSFYCRIDNMTESGPARLLYRLDLETFRSETFALKSGLPYWVIPNFDESKWFIYAFHTDDIFEFQVYDRRQDSITFRKTLVPGNGYMVLTRDGKYVIFSQPGTPISGVPPVTYFTIFDVQANSILKEVNLYPDHSFYFVDELCLTPDDKHLIGMAGWLVGDFFDFNLETMEFNRFVVNEHNKYLFSPSCQTRP